MIKFLTSTVFFVLLGLFSQARAMDVAQVPSSTLATTSSFGATVLEPFSMGGLSPASGPVTLGVSPDTTLLTAPLTGLTPLLTPDFASSYKAQFSGSQLGMSAGFINSGSLYTSAATPGWNVGASLGYAGFYVHAGISDATQQRLISDPSRGWLAGFGYQTGGFNLRLSYMAAQTVNTATDPDSRMWMIGGIYELSSRVRLNADAFTGRDLHAFSTTPAPTTNVAAPQGTGARVGVQLRF